MKYLARYLTGGPISDRRLMSHENGHVTFIARVGRKTGGDDETEPITLTEKTKGTFYFTARGES